MAGTQDFLLPWPGCCLVLLQASTAGQGDTKPLLLGSGVLSPELVSKLGSSLFLSHLLGMYRNGE